MSERIIDLDQIKSIVDLGVTRTAVFMGLGINAAYDDSFNKYELTKNTSIQFIDSSATDSVIKHYKMEFSFWITMNGFRELIETFSIFLENIFDVCISILSTKCIVPKYEKTRKDFAKMGIEAKLSSIEKTFNIKIPYRECMPTINQARNCMAHRRGVLGVEDCINGKFELKWMRIVYFSRKTTGEVVIIELPISDEGILLNKGDELGYKFETKRVMFNIGDFLKLSPQDLSEICYFVIILTDEIVKEVISYANVSGIEVLSTNNNLN
jgi:hypothetical protein